MGIVRALYAAKDARARIAGVAGSVRRPALDYICIQFNLGIHPAMCEREKSPGAAATGSGIGGAFRAVPCFHARRA